MKLTKCVRRHYYDKDKFLSCPICEREEKNTPVKKEINYLNGQTAVLDDEATMRVDELYNNETFYMDEKTAVLGEATMVLDDKTVVLDEKKD